MLTSVALETNQESLISLGASREAIVSWNTLALEGALDVRLSARDGRTSAWLPYVRFDAQARRSFSSHDTFARIDTDVVRSDVDLVAMGIRAEGMVDALFVSTPDYGAFRARVVLPAIELAVPPYSQYEPRFPTERGWCAPASLAMLLAYRAYPLDVPIIASKVFDRAYGGTGNWAFNMAFAGTLGFRAAVVHLRALAHAHAFLAHDIPLALSIAWNHNELPGAPLPASSGHLVVLRGIDAEGAALVNDPARDAVAVTYPRAAFERAWLAHGGVAFAVVPAPLHRTLLRLANA